MKTVIAKLKSTSPYSQSRHYTVPKLDKEGSADYETRTWRHRMHTTKEGYVFIPPMAFKNCLAEAAKFLGIQIPGKGKSTYTKHFEAGMLVTEPLVLPVKIDDVAGEELFVPADGKRGSGKRVLKTFSRDSAMGRTGCVLHSGRDYHQGRFPASPRRGREVHWHRAVSTAQQRVLWALRGCWRGLAEMISRVKTWPGGTGRVAVGQGLAWLGTAWHGKVGRGMARLGKANDMNELETSDRKAKPFVRSAEVERLVLALTELTEGESLSYLYDR